MAQYIRLAVNITEGRNLDTPEVVAARYSRGSIPLTASFSISVRPVGEVSDPGPGIALHASLGGVISAWTALKYPALFGHVLGQSSPF